MGRTSFYQAALATGTVGGGWLAVSGTGVVSFTPCLIKLVTGFPCPTCGSTRAALAFLRGDVMDAVLLNPIGPLAVIAALLVGMFVVRDLVWRRDALHVAYHGLVEALRLPRYAIPLTALVCANWAWNISKGL